MLKMAELYRAKGVEIARLQADGKSSFPRHTHAEYVISANLAGCENIWVDGKSFSAVGKTVTIYNPHAIQSSTFDSRAGAAEFISLYVEPMTLIQIGETTGLLPAASPPELKQGVFSDELLYRSVLDVYAASRSSGDDDLEVALAELALTVLGRGPGVSDSEQAVLSEKRLQMVIEFMKSNLAAPISIETLAAVCKVSKFHLIRSFRSRFGIPPAKYHMQLRLIEARRRLREKQHVQDVAFDLGFYDQSHFINAFRKVLAVSPLRFASPVAPSTRCRRE